MLAVVVHWLRPWLVMTEVVGSIPVIGKDFPHFSFFICYFITCKQTCTLELTGFMIKCCLLKKTLPPNKCKCLIHAVYIPICLQCLKVSVQTFGSELTGSHDH